jgi:uncharacterized membrane protein
MTTSIEVIKCENDENTMSPKSLTLFIVGFFISMIGIIVLIVATMLYGEDSANFDALIFIGPIPIVIGSGPQAVWMILFAIILAVLSIIMFLVMRRGIEKKEA